MMKNIETKKLHKLVAVKRTDAEFKVPGYSFRHSWPKAPPLSTYLPQHSGTDRPGRKSKKSRQKPQPLRQNLLTLEKEEGLKRGQDLQRLFHPSPQDLLHLPKAHQPLYHRKGSYPFTQSEENYIFTLNKSNHKNRILRFLKLYD